MANMTIQRLKIGGEKSGYSGAFFRSDVLAGITVAVFAVPQAMAYAMLAGVAPVYGLYAAVVMSIVAAVFGSSPYVNTGPTNSAALLTATAILPFIPLGDTMSYVATLGLLVGVIRLLMGLARMGNLLDFVSESAFLGFTVGAGVLIAMGQLHHLLGLSAPTATWFPAKVAETLGHAAEYQPTSLAIGLATLILMLAFNNRVKRFPVALAVIGTAGLAAWLFDGQWTLRVVRDVATIPAGLPAVSLPILDLTVLKNLIPAATAIAVLGLIEAASIGQTLALRRNERLNVNREFIGQGLSQIAGAFLSSIPGSGSFSRSLLIETSGAKTRIANIIFGIATLTALFTIPRLLEWIPVAALSGLLLFIGIRLVDVRRIRRVFSTSAPDCAVMILTFAVTVFYRIEFGIFAGIVSGALVHLHRTRELQLVEYAPTSEGRIAEAPCGNDRPGETTDIVALGVSGDLYYGISTALRNRLADIIQDRQPRHLVLRMRRAYSIDYSCWSALFDIAEKLGRQGGRLYLCGIRPDFEPIIRQSDVREFLPADRIFPATESPFQAFDQCMAAILRANGMSSPCARAWKEYIEPAAPDAGRG